MISKGLVPVLMSFLIRLGFDSFVEGLTAGSTVYTVGYVETVDERAEAVIVLTSNGGAESDLINALRMRFEPTETGEMPATAMDKVRKLLDLRGMTWSKGILLTEGLSETLREYGATSFHTLQQLDEWLSGENDNEKEESK